MAREFENVVSRFVFSSFRRFFFVSPLQTSKALANPRVQTTHRSSCASSRSPSDRTRGPFRCIRRGRRRRRRRPRPESREFRFRREKEEVEERRRRKRKRRKRKANGHVVALFLALSRSFSSVSFFLLSHLVHVLLRRVGAEDGVERELDVWFRIETAPRFSFSFRGVEEIERRSLRRRALRNAAFQTSPG